MKNVGMRHVCVEVGRVVMGNMHALWYFPVGHTARTGKAWFVREITGEGEGVQGSCKGKSVLCDTRGTFMIRFSAMALQSQKGKDSCTGQARDT